MSGWTINRNGLFRSIFDGLPGAEQDKFKNRVIDYIAESEVAKPDYFGSYSESQRA